MHYYQHNIGDYRRDTTHLSLLEHGIYRQILDQYYLDESPMTLDHAKLMRSHCVRTAEEITAFENVLSDFFFKTESGYIHKRCDVEIESFHSKSKSASESAKARWERVKAEKEAKSQSKHANALKTDANALPTDCEGNANHKPLTTNQVIPHTPQAGLKPKSAIALQTYLDDCKRSGKKSIDEKHAVFEYATKTGIPQEFLRIQWLEFKYRYTLPGAKRYKAWQTVFDKSVRGNWFKLWYATQDGEYALTTTGQQARAAHKEAA